MITDALKKLRNYEMVNTKYFTVSEGWNKIFKSRRFLDEKNIYNFLNPAQNLTTGIGIMSNNYREELLSFERLKKITLKKNPGIENTLNKIFCENIFGEKPLKFNENINLTRSNLMNGGSFHELSNYVLKKIKKKEIRILEIGSGYGELARQIIKFSEIDKINYDFIDLPENLFFCELYMGTIFGNNAIKYNKFFQKENFKNKKTKCELKFFDPSETSKLKDSYDIIINTYSMQEMRRATASAYIDLIYEKLEDEGVFFSINSPKKWDIKTYKDYNLEKLKNISSRMHRQIPPAGINATVPIVNIFNKKLEKEKKLKSLDLERLILIGELQICGFTDILINKSINSNLSITDPDNKICKLLDEIIAYRNSGDVSKENRSLINLLVNCMIKKKISNTEIKNFLKNEGISSLSDISILLIDQITTNEEIHKTANKLKSFYNLNNKGNLKEKLIKLFNNFLKLVKFNYL